MKTDIGSQTPLHDTDDRIYIMQILLVTDKVSLRLTYHHSYMAELRKRRKF